MADDEIQKLNSLIILSFYNFNKTHYSHLHTLYTINSAPDKKG